MGAMVINALLDYSGVQIAIKPNSFHPHTGRNWQGHQEVGDLYRHLFQKTGQCYE